jgi:hypothetical protein
MADPRFDELREALLEAGVAERKVRRAVMEIESHFQQLIEEECERGTSANDARIKAHVLLGTNEVLVLRYAARPELCTWARRWPAVWFMLLPLIAYIGICAATLLAVLVIANHMEPYLHHVHVAPKVTNAVDLAARIVLLGLFPLFVAAAFAVLAYRRRVSFRWPFSGIALISTLASLVNVGVRFTGGPSPGEVGAGIGLSPESLPGQLTRAVVLASLAMVPLWLAMRRQQRDAHMN